MAMLDSGSGGFSEEEARRRAILARAGRTGYGEGPQRTEGEPGDFGSLVDRTSPSTFSPSGQSTVRDAHDRGSRSLTGEPTSAFGGPRLDSGQQDYIERTAAPNAIMSPANRALQGGAPEPPRGGTPGTYVPPSMQRNEQAAPSQQLAQQGYQAAGRAVQARTPLQVAVQGADQPSGADSQERGLNIIGNVAGAILPVGRIAAPVAQRFGPAVTDFGAAIARRLGIGATRPVAQVIERAGPRAAEEAGRGFRLIGRPTQSLYGATDDLLGLSDDASVIAARARSASAGAREAAGVTDDAAAAAARAKSQQTPLAQAIASRLGRLPTPVKVGATGTLIGAAAVPLLESQASPQQGSENGGAQPQAEQPAQYVQPQGPALPSAQTPQGTPPAPAPTAPRPGEYVAPVAGPAGPVSGPAGPVTPPVVPGQRPGALPPRGPVTPIDPSRPLPGPPMAGQPPKTPPQAGVTPIVEPGRRGGPPVGVTPGQTPAGPTLGPVPGGPLNSEAMRTQVIADLNGIAQQINAGPQAPDVMALFLSQGSKLLDLIAEQEKQLRAQSAAEGSTIDPATQNTLDTLRESLGRELKATKERLNARGLLDSGILIEAEQMLTKGNLSDQAKILAERLSRIQNNLNQGLASFRSQRVDTASRFGMAGAQAQTQAEEAERRRLDDLKRVLVSGRLGVAEQYGREEQAYLDREFRAGESALTREFQAAQAELDRQAAFARAQADMAARAGDREAERAFREQEAALNRENQRLIAEMNNATRQAGQNPQQPTSTSVDLATQNAIAALDQFSSREEAEAMLNAAISTPEFSSTVNIAEVRAAIEKKWPRGGLQLPFGIGR